MDACMNACIHASMNASLHASMYASMHACIHAGIYIDNQPLNPKVSLLNRPFPRNPVTRNNLPISDVFGGARKKNQTEIKTKLIGVEDGVESGE